MIRLYDYLSSAQQADVTSGTGSIDCQPEFQQAVDDAAGLPIELPEGVIRLNSQVSRIPSSATYGGEYAPGMKLFGPGSGRCKIKSHVANDPVFKLATTSANVFQRDVVFSGFRINGENASGGSGVYVDRCYNALFEDCYFEFFDLDGVYVYVAVNDSHSSNMMTLDRCRFYGCERWAFNHDPASGSNDLSFLCLRETTFTQNGVSALKAISDITAAANAEITTAANHGLSTGDKVYLFAIGGMTGLNYRLETITKTADNKFTVPVNTIGTSYTSGGKVMPRIPSSGAIKWRGQMGHFQDGGITETQNVGLFLPDGPAAASRTMLENFTIENTEGVSILVHGCDGLIGRGLDLRNNGAVAKSFAHVLLDASVSSVTGVAFEECAIKASSSVTPHRAFEAISQTNLSEVRIGGTRWQDFDYAGQERFGAGLYGAAKLSIVDENAVQIEPSAFVREATALNQTNPTYVPKVFKHDAHVLVLGSGATGTLTIATPDKGLLAGATSNGRRLLLSITNSSGGSINLALGTFLEATGKPASIANGARVVAEWMWDSFVGWILIRGWATF